MSGGPERDEAIKKVMMTVMAEEGREREARARLRTMIGTFSSSFISSLKHGTPSCDDGGKDIEKDIRQQTTTKYHRISITVTKNTRTSSVITTQGNLTSLLAFRHSLLRQLRRTQEPLVSLHRRWYERRYHCDVGGEAAAASLTLASPYELLIPSEGRGGCCPVGCASRPSRVDGDPESGGSGVLETHARTAGTQEPNSIARVKRMEVD
ncbi:hypothetical protein E2C01_024511 [Portunus trituberculatus]|uniref:Uncharacterized protein n=1 Tax=Portunus trituberculatus TaxID=210409 RepID=A0A5B7ED13_PORTR|nr:hypothetical protein [Portunus trituberculatus]